MSNYLPRRLLAVVAIPVALVSGAAKFVDVSVTLRGKKYNVPRVSTVSEIQKSVEELSGLATSKQGVLFGGQKLKPSDVLEDVGIEDGSEISIVPSSKKKTKKSSSSSSAAASSTVGTATNASTNDGALGGMMADMLKAAGIDAEQLQEMMKNIPGADGNGPPDMMKSMEMMQQMMKSPLFQNFMNDPEKLEQSRQMILQNPMMKAMMAGLPGFEDVINDKEKWRGTMISAAQMYQNMTPDMMKAMASMSSGMGSGMGSGMNLNMPGMGDVSSSPAFAGLDELSEGDD